MVLWCCYIILFIGISKTVCTLSSRLGWDNKITLTKLLIIYWKQPPNSKLKHWHSYRHAPKMTHIVISEVGGLTDVTCYCQKVQHHISSCKPSAIHECPGRLTCQLFLIPAMQQPIQHVCVNANKNATHFLAKCAPAEPHCACARQQPTIWQDAKGAGGACVDARFH